MAGDDSYILAEIWKAKPAWHALSQGERVEFMQQKVGPLIGGFVERGAEVLGCVMNDDDVEDRLGYDYMAVWKMPDKALCNQLIVAAREAGFNEYFEQVNYGGSISTPDVMNGHMIDL